VPHIKIEDTINDILGELASAVTSVPCDIKGEKLIVFYARPDVSPTEVWTKLHETDLPRLWLPKKEHIIPIETIPTLGTGKIDLQALRMLAQESVLTRDMKGIKDPA